MIFNNISFVSFEKEDNGNKKARVGKQKPKYNQGK